jgi:hypothetical protein
MAFVARSVQDLAKQREQRDLTSHHNGLLQISYSECKKLESGPPTVPTSLPGVLNVLEKCADSHGHCWGDRNGIAQDIKAIRYNLRRLQPRLANVPKFAPQRAPTILWTLANAITDYYHTVTTDRDFTDAATPAGDPQYVKSTIDQKDSSLVTLQQAADLPGFLQPLPPVQHKPSRQPDRQHDRPSPGCLSDPIPRTGNPPRTPPPTGRGNTGGAQQQQQGPQLNLNTPASLRHLFARLLEAKWQDLRLNALLETANMTITSLKDMIQAAPHTCMRYAVCGRCSNPSCWLKHIVIALDDNDIAPGLLQPVLENHDLPSQVEAEKVTSLLEVYVDDFIGLIHATDPDLVRHYSRALLHGIHSVSFPPEVSGHHGGDPISRKKMLAGDGVWAVRKEILGWMFDGITRNCHLTNSRNF